MNWEKCLDFGLIEIVGKATIRLYEDRYNYALINAPGFDSTVLSATWQGNSLLVRCLDQYNAPRAYLYRNFYDYYPI